MNSRTALAAAAISALALTTAACGSTTGHYGGGGGTGGGSVTGGTTGGTGGGNGGGSNSDDTTPYKDLDSTAATEALTSKDQHGNAKFGGDPNPAHRWGFGGCKIWFGLSYDTSDGYMPSADMFGVAGHTAWDCNKVNNSVVSWQLHTYLQQSFTAAGPWTDDTSPTANITVNEPRAPGVRFPYTEHCIPGDFYRVVATVTGMMTDGAIPKTTIVSQYRKVTAEDCARE